MADTPRGLALPERVRRVMEAQGRLLVQPRPAGAPPIPLGVRTVEGVPFDVLLTLESLRQLAEQGNQVARFVYDTERTRLGIDRPTTS